MYIYIYDIYMYTHIYSGINETKQRELKLLVSCLHNLQPTYKCEFTMVLR